MTEGAGSSWLPDETRLIALVRDRGTDDWAAGVAVGLADMVGRQRGRTFLANVARGSIELDRLLEAEGGLGLTSALTGAAPVASVARTRPDRPFAYLPAGDAALSYSGLRRMQSFRRFLARVKDGGGTVLLYVGEEDLSADEARGGPALCLDGCVALGEARGAAAALGVPLLARVERPAPPPAETPGPGARPAGTAVAPAAAGPGPDAPGDAPRRRPGAGSLSRLLLPAAALLLLWVAWWLPRVAGGGDVPSPAGGAAAAADGAAAPGGGPARAEAAEPDAAPRPRREFAAPPARYSVLVGSYIRLADAMSQRAALSEEGGLFYVTPTPVRGRIYYRVLAGVHEDRADAAAAMADLVADGRKDALKEWDVRPVHLAYDLGTFAARGGADELVRKLRAADVPAYVLRDTVEASLYRVYAGAFSSEEDAVPLGRRLEELRSEAELITRSGVAP